MIYDAAIIGTGPAGISAALNLKIHEKSFIWLGSKSLSGKIQKAEQVRNYPGLPDISGAELAAAFLRHVQSMDIPIVEEMVNSILSMGKHYALMASATAPPATETSTGARPLPSSAARHGLSTRPSIWRTWPARFTTSPCTPPPRWSGRTWRSCPSGRLASRARSGSAAWC